VKAGPCSIPNSRQTPRASRPWYRSRTPSNGALRTVWASLRPPAMRGPGRWRAARPRRRLHMDGRAACAMPRGQVGHQARDYARLPVDSSSGSTTPSGRVGEGGRAGRRRASRAPKDLHQGSVAPQADAGGSIAQSGVQSPRRRSNALDYNWDRRPKTTTNARHLSQAGLAQHHKASDRRAAHGDQPGPFLRGSEAGLDGGPSLVEACKDHVRRHRRPNTATGRQSARSTPISAVHRADHRPRP